MTAEEISEWALNRGMRAAVVGIDGLEAVRNRLARLETDGELDRKFFVHSLSGFKYLEGCRVEKPLAVVLLAMPRPAHLVSFQMKDGDWGLAVPPTYQDYRPTFDRACAQMQADFGLSPRDLDLVSVPLKTLAAWSGLIRYGRNNLGYVPGWGSYVQLIALAARLPLAGRGEMPTIDSCLLERCLQCRACVKACPTGAITEARFLLHAERCYTLFSESPDPIPPSMPVPSPQCLVGCLRCQDTCPENKGLLKVERTDVVFARVETEAILHDPLERDARTWAGIRDKFGRLGLSEDTRIFARNLRLLTERMHRT